MLNTVKVCNDGLQLPQHPSWLQKKPGIKLRFHDEYWVRLSDLLQKITISKRKERKKKSDSPIYAIWKLP